MKEWIKKIDELTVLVKKLVTLVLEIGTLVAVTRLVIESLL